MSQYYTINDLKVRVSDHEPNSALNGGNDIELYIVSPDNQLLSVEAQIDAICEKKDFNVADFKEVINDFKDGSYTANHFKSVKTEGNEFVGKEDVARFVAERNNHIMSNEAKLEGVVFTHRHSTEESRAELKAIAAERGVSQSFIKKHFNINW